jgi:hypothetical protein
MERATNGITDRVQGAVDKAHEWYPSGFEEASDDELAALRKPSQPGQATTRVATKTTRKPMQSPELAELAADLASDNEKLEVELPDGSMARVRSVKIPEALQG